MITDELFSREFESFHFKEIHRNPPKSLLKPPAGLFGSLGGVLAGSHTIFRNLPSGDSEMYAELEKELAKRDKKMRQMEDSIRHLGARVEIYEITFDALRGVDSATVDRVFHTIWNVREE